MKLTTFLQLFILVDVFFIGVLAATAVRHAYAHFRPPKPEPAKRHPASELPAATRERLLHDAEVNFQNALNQSAGLLQHDIELTAAKINQLLEHMGTEVIGDELENYRAELEQLRKQAVTDVQGIRSGIALHEAELKVQLADEIAQEKQRLINQIDTKLADAVASFLIETLQHNVDLGAQSAYLTTVLEEHKADFMKGVADEN